MSIPVIQGSQGSMNRDIEESYVSNGDYLDAKNVRYTSTQERSTGSFENVLGNEYAFTVGSLSARSTTIKVCGLPETTVNSWAEIHFYHSNGSEFLTTTGSTYPISPDSGAYLAAEITNGSIAPFPVGYFNVTTSVDLTGDTLTYFNGITNVTVNEVCVTITAEAINPLGGPPLYGYDWYIDIVDVTSPSVRASTFIDPPGWPITWDVLQEGVSIYDSGEYIPLRSSNIENDLFVLSTTNDGVASSQALITVSSILNPVTGLELYIPKNTNIVGNQYIYLDNNLNNLQYRGNLLCVVDTVSDPNFDIVKIPRYRTTSIPLGIVVTINSVDIGFGQIGVAIKDENTDLWSYTRLIESKKFNFSVLNEIDLISERNNRGTSHYFTDFRNPPRSFYYYGPYITDGAIQAVNPNNEYSLRALDQEIQLKRGNRGVVIEYISQGNGALNCGNYRYFVRFLTSENTYTNWTFLSQPISVYPEEANPLKIFGAYEDIDSKKSNNIKISWGQSGFYKKIQVGYQRQLIDNAGLIVTDQNIIRTVDIIGSTLSIDFVHTGREQNLITITDAQLIGESLSFSIRRAKNIRTLDNRLILSNVSVSEDLSSLEQYFSLFTYSLQKKAIPISGSYSPSSIEQYSYKATPATYPNYKKKSLGEYEDPGNIFYYTGYMQDERYRFYAVAEFYDGSTSEAFYLFDVTFDTSPTSPDGRRTGGLSDYSLNDGRSGSCLNGNVYVPYIEIQAPINNPFINGLPASQVIKRVHIFRDENIKKTILMNGLGVLGVYQASSSHYIITGSLPSDRISQYTGDDFSSSNNQIIMFPWFADEKRDATNGTLVRDGLELSPTSAWYGAGTHTTGGYTYSMPTPQRNVVSFYSPDINIGDYRLEEDGGLINTKDSILNYGHCDVYHSCHIQPSPYTNTNGSVTYRNQQRFGSIYFNYPPVGATVAPQSTSLQADGAYWFDEGEDKTVVIGGANNTFSKKMRGWWGFINALSSGIATHKNPEGYVFVTSSNITANNITAGERDYGVYFMSYKRNLTPLEQFGEIYSTTPIPTGAFIDLETNKTQFNQTAVSPLLIQVFGGDTFTCKSLLKTVYANTFVPSGTNDPLNKKGTEFNQGIEYYCQSYINPQLRVNPDTDLTDNSFEGLPYDNKIWPNNFNSSTSNNSVNYCDWFRTQGYEFLDNTDLYNDKNIINKIPAYNPNIYYDSNLPATIFYSDAKLQESLTDSYSYIKATNRKDLDITNGPINHHEIFNGELVTFQDSSIERQFFNSTAMLSDVNAQIILGDGGSVLTRKGYVLSTYGTINKWSVIKGKSRGGNDVLYWFDGVNKKVMRLGADGVVPISVRDNINSFIDNNTKYISLYDNPTNGNGVHGVWDDSNNEVIFTFRAKRVLSDWQPNISYLQGTVVYYSDQINLENYDWHKTGEFWICTVPNSTIGIPPTETGLNPEWEHIPHDDGLYYNEFSIVYSEDKNGFTSFLSPKPKLYLKYKNTYLSGRPIPSLSSVYEHNRGNRCVWYEDVFLDSLTEDAFIEAVVNYNPELIKTAEAISVDTVGSLIGSSVEVRSQDHKTFMNSSDFTLAETMYRSPVKNDTQGGTVSPDSDTSRVYGRWFGIKYIMPPVSEHFMRSIVLKIRQRNRIYNK